MRKRKLTIFAAICLSTICLCLAVKTIIDIHNVPKSLVLTASKIQKPQVLDRYGNLLTVTYENRWNIHDTVSLHDIPEFLQTAFIIAEDKRFYKHNGVDWLSRAALASTRCWPRTRRRASSWPGACWPGGCRTRGNCRARGRGVGSRDQVPARGVVTTARPPAPARSAAAAESRRTCSECLGPQASRPQCRTARPSAGSARTRRRRC